jgi:phytoene dehydrogenase-like protein
MARVLIIGGGLTGLSAALEATTAGHHVVALERANRIGGRATSQPLDGFAIGYGPHLLLKNGPFHSIAKRLSRVRLAVSPLRPHRIEVIGHGMIRPTGDVRTAAHNKRALKANDVSDPIVQGAQFLSNWGAPVASPFRMKALDKGKLLVSNEGWAGLVGRMAAALDEVGVFIECGLEVVRIEQGKAHLSDGRVIETDVIVLACGSKTARRLLLDIDPSADEKFSTLQRTTASTIEVGLDSKPFGERQAVVDLQRSMAIIDYIAIQPRLGPSGSHLAAVAVGGLPHDEGATRFGSSEERLSALESFLDERALGWRNHVIQDGRQRNITLHETASPDLQPLSFASKGVVLAGPWVEHEHALADGAVASGRKAGRLISKHFN